MDEVGDQRVRALAEDALARADVARAGLEELLAAVERLRTELTNGAGAHSADPPAPDPPAIGVDAARLVAIEMAVAGRSRQEVEHHLREAYGGSDTSAVLADVFGEA